MLLYFKKARSGAPSGILEQGGGTQCRKERHSAAFLSPQALYFYGLPTIFIYYKLLLCQLHHQFGFGGGNGKLELIL